MDSDEGGWDSAGATATIWRGDRPVYDRGEAVCVIGAGASGLTAIKNLREYGFAVDCFERETGVGGAWNWRHNRSPVYASTHTLSSKPFTQFPDFPMPDDWPDYPDHTRVHGYLDRYAEHFGLREHVWFGTEVVRVEPAEPGGPPDAVTGGHWDVTTRVGNRERTSRYAAVVVANGHHSVPNLPGYEGLDGYRGEVVHSSAYKDPTQLRGRKVLVVGAGNSGCDIAVDAAQQAARCWHSARRGYWYIPKYLRGRPVDQLNDLLLGLRLPLWLRQWLLTRELRRVVGDLTRFGLPRPDHKVGQSHPIVNSQLVYHIGQGDLTPVPDVARFGRSSVELVDGQVIEPDLVIFATGYRPAVDFLGADVLGEQSDLYLNAFAPRYPTLLLAGLVQPDSGLFPIVHWQSVVLATWLRLRENDPRKAAAFWLRAAAGTSERWTDARVLDSGRHRFEISHVRYLRVLQQVLDELEPAR